MSSDNTNAVETTEPVDYYTLPLTHRQAERAHALAAAFGHGWASCPPPGADEAIRALMASGDASPMAIAGIYNEAARHADWATWRHGIPGPDVNDSGIVVHGTGTGRLSWSVDRSGGVDARIYRPGSGQVLHMLVGDAGPEVGKSGGVYCERHVWALMRVADALGFEEQFDANGLLETALLDAENVLLVSLRDGREVTDRSAVAMAPHGLTEDGLEEARIVDGIGRCIDLPTEPQWLTLGEHLDEVAEGDLILLQLDEVAGTYEACAVRRKLPFDQGGEEVTS